MDNFDILMIFTKTISTFDGVTKKSLSIFTDVDLSHDTVHDEDGGDEGCEVHDGCEDDGDDGVDGCEDD